MFVPAWDNRTGQRHDVTEAWLAMDPNLTDVDPATVQDDVDDTDATPATPAPAEPVADKPARRAGKAADAVTTEPANVEE